MMQLVCIVEKKKIRNNMEINNDNIFVEEDIGKEFLMWLYDRCKDDSATFDLEEGPVAVWFDNKLVFEQVSMDANEKKVKKVQVSGENANNYQESKEAYKSGKELSEAKLCVNAGELNWAFTLKASYEITGLKLPNTLVKEKEMVLMERIYFKEHLTDILDQIFQSFLKERNT